MFKKMALCCLALCLMISSIAIAEHSGVAANEYAAIERMFGEATSAGVDYWEALEKFKDIVDRYESYEQVQKEGRAFQYYSYARGMVLFDEKEYQKAAESFAGCGDLGSAKEYIYYAKGMTYKEAGAYRVESYKDAMAAFEAAWKCEVLASAAAIQYNECHGLYKEAIMKLGDAAFDNGEYETAMGYYEALAQEADVEGMQKYNMCLAKVNKTDEQSIVVSSFEENPKREISITITTTESECEVLLYKRLDQHTDISEKNLIESEDNTVPAMQATMADDQGWLISGLEPGKEYDLRIVNLLPNTEYLIDFVARDQMYEYRMTTAPAEEYSPIQIISGSYWRYGQRTYIAGKSALREGQTIWETIFNEPSSGGSLRKIEDDGIAVSNGALNEWGYCIWLETNQKELTKESISGKACQVVMHVDDLVTIAMESSLCGEEDSILEIYQDGKEPLILRVTDVFKKVLNEYPEAVGNAYTIDCLLDGQLLYSISGKLL